MDDSKNSEIYHLIMRQTDYDYDTAVYKLSEHNGDVKEVIREYIGCANKIEQKSKTTNQQEIYKQIRMFLDNK